MQPVIYPLYDRKKQLYLNRADHIALCANSAESGTYPVAKNNYWHGGMHFARPPHATFSDIVVQSIARGKVIAYRFHDDWEKAAYTADSPDEQQQYSRNFVLIKHHLEHQYTSGEIFKGYQFYSLYMHLAPISVMKSGQALPWFLTGERKKFGRPVKRNEPLTLLESSGAAASGMATPETLQTNGLLGIQTASGQKGWVPLGMVAKDKASGQYVSTHPIEYYYEANGTELFAKAKLGEVKKCSYDVEAGDIIGLPGGTIVGGGFKDDFIHFEIFVEDIKFLDNLTNQIGNRTKQHYNKSIASPDSNFAAGKFHLHTPPAAGAATPAGTPPASPWAPYYFIGADKEILYTAPLTPSGFHNLFDPAFNTTQRPHTDVLNIVSDVEWKKGPEPWGIKEGKDFLSATGLYENIPAKPLPDAARLIVKQPTEWSDHDLPKRFEAQKENLGDKFNDFIDFVKGHCFWKDARGGAFSRQLPAYDKVWHFHPVDFIEQMRRIFTPYHDADPMKLKRYLDRHFNESIIILKKRKAELETWLGTPTGTGLPQGTVTHDIDKHFGLWFGYKYTITGLSTAAADAQKEADAAKIAAQQATEAARLARFRVTQLRSSRYAKPEDIKKAEEEAKKLEAEAKEAQTKATEAQTKVTQAQNALDTERVKPLSTVALQPVPLPSPLPDACDNNRTEPAPGGGTQPLKLAIPNVPTVAKAIEAILKIIDKSIAAFEKDIVTENVLTSYIAENFETNGAYVYSTDTAKKHIHLGHAFLENRNINNSATLAASTGSASAPFSRTVMSHECSHFSDIGGLHDLFVYDGLLKIGPYGSLHCKRIAELNPCASLCNADNFARFINHDAKETDLDHYDYY